MSFAQQSWTKRFEKLGDEAEDKWLEVAHEYVGIGTDGGPCTVRMGLNRPPFNPSLLPSSVRLTPDFVSPIGWIECKGVGRDQILKVKVENLMDMFARARQEQNFPVHLFVWDSHKKRHTLVTTDRLFQLIDKGDVEHGLFPEPKAYYGFRCAELFVDAERKPRKRNRRAPLKRCRRVPNVSKNWTPKQDFAGGDDAGNPLFRLGFPETETQALMECAPGQEPRATKQQMQDKDAMLRRHVMKGMECLTPSERVIITAFFWEGDGAHSLEERLRELRDSGLYDGPVAHSQIQRLYTEAMTKLRLNTINPYQPKGSNG